MYLYYHLTSVSYLLVLITLNDLNAVFSRFTTHAVFLTIQLPEYFQKVPEIKRSEPEIKNLEAEISFLEPDTTICVLEINFLEREFEGSEPEIAFLEGATVFCEPEFYFMNPRRPVLGTLQHFAPSWN